MRFRAEKTRKLNTMETVRRFVERQRVFHAVEGKLSVFDPIRHAPDNAAEIRRRTILITPHKLPYS